MRSTFHGVERNTLPFELIHNDVCNLKFVQTRGDNKYFIILWMITRNIAICTY